MKNKIAVQFYIDTDKYYRNNELRDEFLKYAYDVFMEKDDTKNVDLSFDKVNKYIDLKSFCMRSKQKYDKNSIVGVRYTFYRDASSKYAKEHGLTEEWNKRKAALRGGETYKKEHLDKYQNGEWSIVSQANANVYVARCGNDEDKKAFENTKVKNLSIGKNTKLSDAEVVYKLYKEYGVGSKEVKNYITTNNLASTKRNGMIKYYIENELPKNMVDEELKLFENSLILERKEKEKNSNNRKANVASKVINKLLDYNENDLDVALAKCENLTKDDLFMHLEILRNSAKSKYNELSLETYAKFLKRYPNNDEIVDNRILKLVDEKEENPEVLKLKYLYDVKRDCSFGVNAIRSLVASGVIDNYKIMPLKKAINSSIFTSNGPDLIQDSSLINSKYTVDDKVSSQEDKVQALKFLRDNNMPVDRAVYSIVLKNYIYGLIDIYGTTREEIFKEATNNKVLVRK